MLAALKFSNVVLILSLLTLFASCRKLIPEKKALPPLTTTGEGTFGCLVNGKVFLPRKEGLYSAQQCVYQRVYAGDHGYVFLLKANHEDGCVTQSVSIYLDSIMLVQNATYQLTLEKYASNNGVYRFGDCNSYERFTTDSQNRGQLTIKHLDEQNNIVAGTFSFNITAADGTKHVITDGRFDQSFNR